MIAAQACAVPGKGILSRRYVQKEIHTLRERRIRRVRNRQCQRALCVRRFDDADHIRRLSDWEMPTTSPRFTRGPCSYKL